MTDHPTPLGGIRAKFGLDDQAEHGRAATDRPSSELSQLLSDVEAHASRFVSFASRHQSVVVSLWMAHVYAIDGAPSAAYLRIKSAAEESGKTTLLEVMGQVLGKDRAINAVSISPSVVYRLRDKVGPVAILLDEVDNTLKGRQDDGARDLLAIVNAGYKRSAMVYRSESKSFEPRGFAAFGPAVIAGIGNLAATTESRCIPVTLSRKPRGSCERYIGFLVESDARVLTDRFEAWAGSGVVDRLRAHVPIYPEDLRDRHVETWWPLFSIADEAGGDWPSLAREAALALHVGQSDESTLSLGVLLLAHIREAFEKEGDADRLPTADLLRALVENESGPWGRWWGVEVKRDGSALAAASGLAKKLGAFGIKPTTIRMPDGTTPRGYLRESFEEAWAVYLTTPPATPTTAATPLASHVAAVVAVAPPSPRGNEAQIPTAADVIVAARVNGHSDERIAAAMKIGQIRPPAGAEQWSARAVAQLVPRGDPL